MSIFDCCPVLLFPCLVPFYKLCVFYIWAFVLWLCKCCFLLFWWILFCILSCFSRVLNSTYVSLDLSQCITLNSNNNNKHSTELFFNLHEIGICDNYCCCHVCVVFFFYLHLLQLSSILGFLKSFTSHVTLLNLLHVRHSSCHFQAWFLFIIVFSDRNLRNACMSEKWT